MLRRGSVRALIDWLIDRSGEALAGWLAGWSLVLVWLGLAGVRARHITRYIQQ
jgi:hypothetical protein